MLATYLGMLLLHPSAARTEEKITDSCINETGLAEAYQVDETEEKFPEYVPRARWSENWSRLRVEGLECTVEQLPFKHIKTGNESHQYLSFGGEYRFTYERYSPDARGFSGISSKGVRLHRFAGHADWRPVDRWRFFAQLGAARSSGREGGNKAGDDSDANLWQLFVDHRIPLQSGERVDIRVGRQFIEKYNFLIGAGEARNVRQYYDGARVAWIDKGFAKLDIYAAEFVDAAEGSFDMRGTGEYFWGVNSELRFGTSNISFLYFGWELKNLQFEQGGGERHDETRHTFTLRWHRPLTVERQWIFDSDLIYQFGKYDDPSNSRTSAYAVFGDFKYAFSPTAKSFITGLKAGYYSGDDDPDDNKLNTFYDPIFVTPYFSYARDVMPYNLMHIQPSIAYRFNSGLQFTLSKDFLWRAEKNDAFYTGASAIGVSASQSDSRYIGEQIQLSVNYVFSQQVVFSFHWVEFKSGDVVDDAGGSDQRYVHFGLSFLF